MYIHLNNIKSNLSIVPTNVNYSYSILMSNINQLKKKHSFLHIGYIGKSVLGNPIPYIKIGNGKKEVCYIGAFHANEWITSVLLTKFIEDFSNAYVYNSFIYGYKIREIFNTISLYIIPMLNPDGVNLVTGEIVPSSNIYKSAKKIADKYPNIPFPSGWKANIKGVDLKIYQPVCKVL